MSKETEFRLLISIVNYKSAELVCRLLEGLIPQLDNIIDRVCIVDNNSQDKSIDIISKFIADNKFDEIVDLVAAENNGGFSSGNNIAITSVSNEPHLPEFIMLLNPDTLVCEGAIGELIDFMRKHPEAGIAGSQIKGEDDIRQCSSFRFHTILSEIESSLRLGFISKLLSRWKVSAEIGDNEMQTDWVSGASMLIRYELIKDIGLMDEDYFLYFEETDYCLQAKRKGWECWYVPSSKIIHYVGQSTGVISGNPERSRRPQYWFESRQHYYVKNYGFLYTMVADACWGVGFSIWRLRRLIQNKADTDPKHMLFDFWKNSIFFRPLKRK